jgi:hypothetical protein
MSNYKLRLKDPSGAEFEAEGPADFVQNEKACFLEAMRLKIAKPAPRTEAGSQDNAQKPVGGPEDGFWEKIITIKDNLISLRFKYPEISAAEAALILLAANRALNQSEDLSAIALSKALRSSGYQPDRLDRLLSNEIKTGKAAASGTKRNRTYRITQKGLEKTCGVANKLAGNNGQ